MATASPTHTFHTTSPVLALAEPSFQFGDSHYLLEVIGHLNRARVEQGMSSGEVARRARIKRSLIDRAEKTGSVLSSRDFKAWASVLGFSWDQVWSDCLPGRWD